MVGALLLLLLLAVAVKRWVATRDMPEVLGSDDQAGQEACPAEFVRNIFSPVDWHYVRGMNAPDIEKLFRKERRAVALVWVRQTASAIRRIMREHAAAARLSSNLSPATELRIFLQFAALLMICAAIRVGIDVAGPMRVGALARYAQTLAQRIADAEQAFELGIQERVRPTP